MSSSSESLQTASFERNTLVDTPTARSSLTLHDPVRFSSQEEKHYDSPLEEEIARDEDLMSRYGGDDVHDPPKAAPASTPSPIAKPPRRDPNMVDWDGPNDLSNPQNWSTPYKWFVTGICMLLCANVTFASSAPSTLSHKIVAHFDKSREVGDLVTSVFLLGYCFGPLLWGPGSELVGRKKIFIVSMVAYTLFHLGQALAQNIETLLITRFLSGFFACAPLTNAAGVIADIWNAEGRGIAVSLFTASVFMGPVLGPVVSGFIAQSDVTWRWVFWVMMIFAGTCTMIVFLLPETYAPVIMARKAERLRAEDPIANKDIYSEHERQDWSTKGVLHRTLYRPFQMLVLEPILVLLTLYMSLVYGLLYALFQAIPIIFVEVKGFSLGHTGLIFIGVGIGTTMGAVVNILTSRRYPELLKKWKGFPPPENRLFAAMIGSPILVIGCFWLGWTGQYASVPWYVPALSTIFIGTGISSIFMSFIVYIVDAYLMYSASALAVNTIVRSGVAAAFPLFTVQMFNTLGIQWACTLIGFMMLLFAPAPFLFYRYGPKIRERSTFAPGIDLRIAKQMAEDEKKGADAV